MSSDGFRLREELLRFVELLLDLELREDLAVVPRRVDVFRVVLLATGSLRCGDYSMRSRSFPGQHAC